jgi:hypothetical protein
MPQNNAGRVSGLVKGNWDRSWVYRPCTYLELDQRAGEFAALYKENRMPHYDLYKAEQI